MKIYIALIVFIAATSFFIRLCFFSKEEEPDIINPFSPKFFVFFDRMCFRKFIILFLYGFSTTLYMPQWSIIQKDFF